MTKKEVLEAKRYVQNGLHCKYGFYPPLSWIEIDEDESTVQFVDFSVHGRRYTYDGITMICLGIVNCMFSYVEVEEDG